MRTAPDYSPSACRVHTQKPDIAVRDEPLADVNESCLVALVSLECSAHASHGCCLWQVTWPLWVYLVLVPLLLRALLPHFHY